MATEILASLDDIQAHLPDRIAIADSDDTQLIQISVARIVRGYLARVIANGTLVSWVDPATTPELIREIAGRLIAAQLFFNKTAESSTNIEERSFAQLKYNEAIAMLDGIIAGELVLDGVVIGDTSSISDLDFFPIDDTDRAFTLGMEL